ncbi:MAG: flagellar hook-basal body complex protein FliE [Nitrospirae bacterium]|nr:flagellar hook-basal body complex protein FliE [Nitrospirota bacterium]
MNDIAKIQDTSVVAPETPKLSNKKADNAFSDVLNNVLSDAADIQAKTVKSIGQVSNLGVENIKVEMARAGDAMQRMQQAREKLLSAYKSIDHT